MQALDSLYIHVPFCDGKCFYCAFYSVRYERSLADRYLDSLAREFDGVLEGRPACAPRTVYFGGGTPSVLADEQLARLCDIVVRRIDRRQVDEWTAEANPATLSPTKIEILVGAGINRVSIGAQSFDARALRTAGRRHSPEQAAETVSAVRAAGIDNVGLDLIAALPGVGPATWRMTLEAALRLAPRHLSVYDLSIEAGTRFHERHQSGQLAVHGEEAQIRALRAAERQLLAAGMERYEISNFAQPGYACLHNLGCWRGEDYLGLGPAAATRDGRQRRTNADDLPEYIEHLSAGRPPPRRVETLSPEADLQERLAFAFRLTEGVDLAAFCRRRSATDAQRERWERRLAPLLQHGLLERRGPRWTPTPRGLLLADTIAAELLGVD